MEWSNKVVQKVGWNGEISNKEKKLKIAKQIAIKAQDGDVIGFGSGSTSLLAVEEIAKRVKEESLKITAIPTSREIDLLCQCLGIRTATLNQQKPDWGFDGADEVSPKNWLNKGRGGAMFREKLNISNAKNTYILVDDSKFVDKICDNFPIPVECFPDALHSVKESIYNLGAKSVKIRLAKGKDGPIITENGNIILDTIFENVNEELEKELKNIVGVLETGLFIGYNITILK